MGAGGWPGVAGVQGGSHALETVGGELGGVGEFGAFVSAANGDESLSTDASPGDLAMTIAQLIIAELAQGPAFASAMQRPADMEAKNLFSTKLATLGFSMWLVTWSQAEEINTTALAGIAADLLRIHAEYDIAAPTGTDLIDDIT